MPQFPSTIDLTSLNGVNGFQISGELATDHSGCSVAWAGDINGDGFADLIIGAYSADPNGVSSGASWVVFGQASGFAPNLNLSTLDGSNGFQINGELTTDRSGKSVAGAGDVNGDGFADIVIGGYTADLNGANSGASYVVFGKASGFAANLELSSLTGANGFQINGEAPGDNSGVSVASAGDVNGDGFADLIIGASNADPNGVDSGASYVVFGKASGFAANLELSSLTGFDGFQISGEAAGYNSGFAVSSAGDINGDGFDDVIVGAPAPFAGSGTSHIVFGKAAGFSSNLDVSTLDGTNGFQITGEGFSDSFGFSVAAAGDVNGDGLADIIVGSPGNNAGYVVFGKTTSFSANLDITTLDGTNGFQITGTGTSVASAGDVNGDGISDLVISGNYVLFGKASGFASTIDLATLDVNAGFRLLTSVAAVSSGGSVVSNGDINADGFSDIILGAHSASPNGSASGASYVVFGRAPEASVNYVGSAAGQTMTGGAFGDILNGGGGNDRIVGMAGNDAIDGGTGDDTMFGGSGDDTYIVDSATDVVMEAGGEGTDSVETSVTLILAANVENLTATGAASIDLTGNSLSNILTGNSNHNTIIGGGGIDVMAGGAGNDTYDVDILADSVIENEGEGTADTVRSATMNLTAFFYTNVENFTLTGSGNLNITGDEQSNTLVGNSGNNMLIGGGGTDHLFGGFGNDTYDVDGTEDVVTDADGLDTVRSQSISLDVTNYSSVENLTLTGSANLDLFGDSGENVLTGNSGNNFIFDGNGGADFLIGGLGDDTYQNDGGNAQVFETASGGNDTVQSFNQSLDLSSFNYFNVENAKALGAGAIFLTGNADANVLTGNSGNNTIVGNGGADTMIGGAGDDTFEVDVAGDVVTELVGGGTDTVRSATLSLNSASYANIERLELFGSANLNLTGNAAANTVAGNFGANFIIGGAGRDSMSGGSGVARDTFDFNSVLETGKTAATRDAITDFAHLTDRIDLKTIDASSKKSGDQAFKFIGTAAFHRVAGELHVRTEAGNKIVEGDTNGDGRADFQIQVNGLVALSAGDFVL